MEDEPKNTNAGKGLGIAGFVLGIIALIISFIPCLGMWALIPGIIATIFSAIAISQATKANAARGLIIAALIISIISTSVAAWQLYLLQKTKTEIENSFNEAFGDSSNFSEGMDKLGEDMDKLKQEGAFDSLEQTTDSIKL